MPGARKDGLPGAAVLKPLPLTSILSRLPASPTPAVKVLAYLTMPVDPSSDRPHLQAAHMRATKAALLDADALAALVGLLAGPLSRHPDMAEEDRLAVQLVLTFMRNLLAVPEEQGAGAPLQVGPRALASRRSPRCRRTWRPACSPDAGCRAHLTGRLAPCVRSARLAAGATVVGAVRVGRAGPAAQPGAARGRAAAEAGRAAHGGRAAGGGPRAAGRLAAGLPALARQSCCLLALATAHPPAEPC
jgi:hypothetical protein